MILRFVQSVFVSTSSDHYLDGFIKLLPLESFDRIEEINSIVHSSGKIRVTNC